MLVTLLGKVSNRSLSPIRRLLISIDREQSVCCAFFIRALSRGISISCEALTHFGLENKHFVKLIRSLLRVVSDRLVIGDRYVIFGETGSVVRRSFGKRPSMIINILVCVNKNTAGIYTKRILEENAEGMICLIIGDRKKSSGWKIMNGDGRGINLLD